MMCPLDLALPSGGHWLVQMSPADRVPSHGTHLFATTYAIDFVPVDASGRSLSATGGWRSRPAQDYVGFGRSVDAPIGGVVVTASDILPDHEAPRGLALIRYLATQRGRAAEGWGSLAGNHVVIRAGDAFVALCHLQRGSITVAPGEKVRSGQPVARCGNSGNSTEPHLHLQAMDGPDPVRAQGLPISLGGFVPRNGSIVQASA